VCTYDADEQFFFAPDARTVGTTIDSAVAWFVQLEHQCHVALLDLATGRKVRLSGGGLCAAGRNAVVGDGLA
jgi:hypothetical protein